MLRPPFSFSAQWYVMQPYGRRHTRLDRETERCLERALSSGVKTVSLPGRDSLVFLRSNGEHMERSFSCTVRVVRVAGPACAG
jgi:hypothetical protein